MSEFSQFRSFVTSTRHTLDIRALRWARVHNAPCNTLREAITAYLAQLDPHSNEWSDWIDAYGEGKLIHLFGVDDI